MPTKQPAYPLEFLRCRDCTRVEIADLAVDGNDLAKLGIQGLQLGATLRRLLEAVINDPRQNTRDQLLKLAKDGAGPA